MLFINHNRSIVQLLYYIYLVFIVQDIDLVLSSFSCVKHLLLSWKKGAIILAKIVGLNFHLYLIVFIVSTDIDLTVTFQANPFVQSIKKNLYSY